MGIKFTKVKLINKLIQKGELICSKSHCARAEISDLNIYTLEIKIKK
jgi:hypothetical protein